MSTKELIKALINSIDTTVKVLSAVDNGDQTYSFTLDGILWLRVGKVLSYGNGDAYKVISITGDSEAGFVVVCRLISGTFSPSYTSLNVPTPYYFHGSVRMINSEVSKIRKSSDKVPMFYLRTLDEATYPNEKTDRFLYNAPIELFVLDEANYKDWISNDYESEIISPLRSLLDAFIDALVKNEQAIEREPYQVRPIIKFAREDDNGNVSKYFTDDLSGWRFRTNLNVKKPLDCCKENKIKLKL